MRHCDCKQFKKIVIDRGMQSSARDWNYCIFCGKKMKDKVSKGGR